MATRVRIERRNAHKAVHTVLALEPPIGIMALNHHGRRLDPRALAFRLFDPFDLVAMRFSPAHVHAHQHIRPVLALSAAGAGMHFEVTVIGIGLARQKRFQLAAGHLGLEASERGFGLADGLVVLFRLAELDKRELILEFLLDAADRLELIVQRITLAHHALRARLIVPEIGVFQFLVQFGEASRRGVDVKDASSAAARTA